MSNSFSHFENYINTVHSTQPEAALSIRQTVKRIIDDQIKTFTHQDRVVGLLLGQVQSGKTGQVFGVVSATADADPGFTTFVLLTSDNRTLQRQTYKRALEMLDTFNVCDENDDVRFISVASRKPSLIVLKKNKHVLTKWRNLLRSAPHLVGRPIFIVDDEADAASPNTLINQREQSTINTRVNEIRQIGTSSLYLQVTATPQAVFLQSEESGFRPSFVTFFKPGEKYLGGDFFYSNPGPFTNRSTSPDELQNMVDTLTPANGLMAALATFLVTCAHIERGAGRKNCNFLLHPSVSTGIHAALESCVASALDLLYAECQSDEPQWLKAAWDDLRVTRPDLLPWHDAKSCIRDDLVVRPVVLNSVTPESSEVDSHVGYNVFIGGNTLGRGVTFPRLQTVYYCRTAKAPQVDTFWQHCRMFGYDRDPMTMRVFMPRSLFILFSEMNDANQTLIRQIEDGKLDELHVITSKGLKPTRSSVIDSARYNLIVGGVNYFPPVWGAEDYEKINKEISALQDGETSLPIPELISLLRAFSSHPDLDWSIPAFISALNALAGAKDPITEGLVIVRRDRSITQGTGTLLSPTDRNLGGTITDRPVLTLYQLRGEIEKGWSGQPLWVPNIKLPSGSVFHRLS